MRRPLIRRPPFLPLPPQVAADDMLTVKMDGGEAMTDVAPVVLCTVLGKAGVPPEAFVSPDDEGCFSGLKGESTLIPRG